MADYDIAWDLELEIADHVGAAITELLQRKMNEYQCPNYLQAARVFVDIVAPWDIVGPPSDSRFRNMARLMLESLKSAKWSPQYEENFGDDRRKYIDVLTKWMERSDAAVAQFGEDDESPKGVRP